MISYQTDGIEMPAIKKRETTEWIKAVAATYNKRIGEIAYIFCSDEKILEVNRQYLQHDYYTDIITFDYGRTGNHGSRRKQGARHAIKSTFPKLLIIRYTIAFHQ